WVSSQGEFISPRLKENPFVAVLRVLQCPPKGSEAQCVNLPGAAAASSSWWELPDPKFLYVLR
ncbi:MAG TPA: hypothetical protein VK850_19915, partial [Candidatus Binatia bacterium]|nr:hypothetical protein [Candidatus Binatia bacterium]